MLVHRLKTSPDEERSCIFLNIWRFANRGTDVEKVYLKHLKAASINLQVDIVVGLGMLSLTPTLVDTYRSLLVRADDPIRRQVLENLASTSGHDRSLFKAELADLISHQDDRIRQAAVRLWARR
jgi:hypothetical protein